MLKQKKIRLDELMVRQGLAADAGEALRLVLAHQVKVGDEYLHACVDGPDFDGHLVDFDDAMRRGVMYRSFESAARDAAEGRDCNGGAAVAAADGERKGA